MTAHPISLEELKLLQVKQWDDISLTRYEQITTGKDITYNEVFIPLFTKKVLELHPDKILDAGCGLGLLTNHLATLVPRIVGVDPSSKNIEFARRFKKENTSYFISTIEDFQKDRGNEGFDLIICNMVLMDTSDIQTFINSVSKLLTPEGKLIFTITHPLYWPRYAGYSDASWFSYDEEIAILNNFKISNEESNYKTVHFHRPIERYKRILENAGLYYILEDILPDNNTQKKYPTLWKFPRYLYGECKK